MSFPWQNHTLVFNSSKFSVGTDLTLNYMVFTAQNACIVKPSGYYEHIFLNQQFNSEEILPVNNSDIRSRSQEEIETIAWSEKRFDFTFSNDFPKYVSFTYLHGKTVVPPCFNFKNPWHKNPSHFLMGAQVLYNIGYYKPSYAASVNHIGFWRCANPFGSNWDWAKKIYDATTSKFVQAKFFSSHKNEVKGAKGDHAVCFDEISFFRPSWGLYVGVEVANDALDAFERFSKTINQTVFEDNMASHLDPRDLKLLDSPRSTRCIKKFADGDSMRRLIIGINMRSKRVVDNLLLVIDIAQKFTSEPIRVFSVSENTTFADQFKIFNSFDIIISTTGSQLANVFLFQRKDIGVIELAAVVRDDSWMRSATRVGIPYKLSTGHNIGRLHNKPAELLVELQTKMHAGCLQRKGTDIFYCHEIGLAWEITDCPLEVNGTIFESHLDELIQAVCVS